MSKDGCMWSRKDGGDLGDTIASSTQPQNWLEEREGENNKVSTLVWKKPGNREKQKKEASKKERKAKWKSSKRVSTKKILEMEESIWKGKVRVNASAKDLGVIDRQWISLVITLGGCSKRTRWSSFLDWTTTYTILQWPYYY